MLLTKSSKYALHYKKTAFIAPPFHLIRYKHYKRDNRSIIQAIEYFDTVYPKVYGDLWPKIKEGLLGPPRYGALINPFCDTDKVLQKIEDLGGFDVGAFYNKRRKELNESLDLKKNIVPLSKTDRQYSKTEFLDLPEVTKAVLMSQEQIKQSPLTTEMDIETRIFRSSEYGTDLSHVTNFVPSTELKGLEDWMEEGDVLEDEEGEGLGITSADVDVDVEEFAYPWPRLLQFYAFVPSEEEPRFPSPRKSATHGTVTHYLMNAASVLPVVALDICDGDLVLDMCASPGGKALAILFSSLADTLVCNDPILSRYNHLKEVISNYIPQNQDLIQTKIILDVNSSSTSLEKNTYDKILVDAPCLTDRHSATSIENSIFKSTRLKERNSLPRQQSRLIRNALLAVKPGGCVVYSTCTLSPLQNDGAVQMAINAVSQKGIKVSVVDMSTTLFALSFMYRSGFKLGLRYGHVVFPMLDNNAGPVYICKIIKHE